MFAALEEKEGNGYHRNPYRLSVHSWAKSCRKTLFCKDLTTCRCALGHFSHEDIQSDSPQKTDNFYMFSENYFIFDAY